MSAPQLHPMLTLEFPTGSIMLEVHNATVAVASAGSGAQVVDLAEVLGRRAEVEDQRPVWLLVDTEEGPVAFQTNASLRLRHIDPNNIYKLPALMRDGPVQPWVCGLATVREGSYTSVAVWVDLVHLARNRTEHPYN